MTKNFDLLIESLLSEMMPMSFDDYGSIQTVIDKIVTNIISAKNNSGHWNKAYSSKKLKGISDEELEPMLKEMVTQVVHELFPEKNNTYSSDLTKENFRDKLQQKIKQVFELNNTYSKFLSDRFANSELLGQAKEIIEVATAAAVDTATKSSDSGKGVKLVEVPTKADTQRTMDKALAGYLKKYKTSNKSVWTKSKDQEEQTTDEPAEEPAEKSSPEKEVETVYVKSADLNSDDPELQKVFNKLPSDKDMSWEEVLKKIGMTKGLALIKAGGLIETEKEKEVGEDEDVPALDAADNDDVDLSNFDKMINPYFSTTKGSWRHED